MTVLKDLVPDLSTFYEQYSSIKPWLRTKGSGTTSGKEHLQVR